MKADKFEDLLVWQKAMGLAVHLHSTFNKSREYGFRDQILRASVSVINNIAEGFERKSNAEFKHFLYISTGSCGEIRSMLHLAKDTNTIDTDKYVILLAEAVEISKMLSGLIRKL